MKRLFIGLKDPRQSLLNVVFQQGAVLVLVPYVTHNLIPEIPNAWLSSLSFGCSSPEGSDFSGITAR